MDDLETLIFRTDRLGDFIISAPFIISYKENFKNNSITLVSSDYNSNYIKKFYFVDNVISIETKVKFFPKLIILLNTIIKLRKKKYHKIIILDGKKRSFFISLFLNGKKYFLSQSKDLELFAKLFRYTMVVNYQIQNQLKNFSYLASVIGFNFMKEKINIYKDYKFDSKYNLKNNYITLHLDEKWFTKFYYNDFTDINPNPIQLDRFINKILDETGNRFDIVITTGNFKLKLFKDYVNLFKNTFKKNNNHNFEKKYKNNSIIIIEDCSFNNIEHIIMNSSYLICCEGGVSHVSYNFKIKTIAFYEKNRLQHMKYWTEHMNKLILYERKNMSDLLEDKFFFTILKKSMDILE